MDRDRMAEALAERPATRIGVLRVLGAAALAALGKGTAASAAPQTEAKRKRKPRSNTRVVVSAESPSLGPIAGNQSFAEADCGGPGRVVSCGYQTAGGQAAFRNVIVEFVGPTNNRQACVAGIGRTADVETNGAGATIAAVALCRG